ncbi:dihydroorotate dehydrogenase electron transfer subunit [bacterium]|nr:dihydroorotate dehydrogenase electron transfer subunit [bacterium]
MAEHKKIHKGIVKNLKKCSKDIYLLELESETSFVSTAGQFISIFCERTLRRPFSIYQNDGNTVSVLFREIGKGTKYLTSLKENDIVDFSGPFGNGFEIKNKRALLIGAGAGVAPVSYLKTELEKRGIESLLISGFRDKDDIPSCLNSDFIVTDDGSNGIKSNVIDFARLKVKEFNPEIIYSCGPLIVLKKSSELAKELGIEAQVSMEKVMACSIGVCRGCVIDVIKEGQVQNASVCKDGPVFKGSEVVWKI